MDTKPTNKQKCSFAGDGVMGYEYLVAAVRVQCAAPAAKMREPLKNKENNNYSMYVFWRT